jgi:hypothetical protein
MADINKTLQSIINTLQCLKNQIGGEDAVTAVNNGLMISNTGVVQLGQGAGDAGDPAKLLSNRIIPMNDFSFDMGGGSDITLNAHPSTDADNTSVILQLSTTFQQALLQYGNDTFGAGSITIHPISGKGIQMDILASGGMLSILSNDYGTGGLGLFNFQQGAIKLQGDTADPGAGKVADIFGAMYFNTALNAIRYRGLDGWHTLGGGTWDSTMAASADLSTSYVTTIADGNNWTITSTSGGLAGITLQVNNTADGGAIAASAPSANAIYGETQNSVGVKGVALTTGTGLVGSSIDGNGLFTQSSNAMALSAEIHPASTNTLAAIANYSRNTQSAAANGIGQLHTYSLQDSSGQNIAGQFSVQLDNVTAGSQSSSMAWWLRTAGSALVKRSNLDGTGILTLSGDVNTTHTNGAMLSFEDTTDNTITASIGVEYNDYSLVLRSSGGIIMRDRTQMMAGGVYIADTPTSTFQTVWVNPTWNNAAIKFSAFSINPNNTASAARASLFVAALSGTPKFQVTKEAFCGIGLGVDPNHFLEIAAGTATAAPIRLNPAGVLLTTPVNGALETDGTNLYFTVGGVRKTVTLT